jgi:hypothetical protein
MVDYLGSRAIIKHKLEMRRVDMAIMYTLRVWEPKEWRVHIAEGPVAKGHDNTWMVQKGQSKIVRSETLPMEEAFAAAKEELARFNTVELSWFDTNWGHDGTGFVDDRVTVGQLSELG